MQLIEFIDLTFEDLELIRNWRNSKYVSDYMYNNNIISKLIYCRVFLEEKIGLSFSETINDIHDLSKKNKDKYFAPYSIMKTMRAGVLVLAPLLAKFGKARVSLPGGCSIGARPVNLHLDALKKLGAKINVKSGYIDASAPKGLLGANIKFPFISVGATESIIIAAVLAKGVTKIRNAALEPEIIDLIKFLNKCGARIKYNSKRKIIIKGVKYLYPIKHRMIPDRIEAATYAIAALITNGKLLIKNVNNDHLENIFNVLKKSGAKIKTFKDSFVIFKKHQLKPFKITTKPYPGFPTDMQAQFMSLATQIKGSSVINEKIFENRFWGDWGFIHLCFDIQGMNFNYKPPEYSQGQIALSAFERENTVASSIIEGSYQVKVDDAPDPDFDVVDYVLNNLLALNFDTNIYILYKYLDLDPSL